MEVKCNFNLAFASKLLTILLLFSAESNLFGHTFSGAITLNSTDYSNVCIKMKTDAFFNSSEMNEKKLDTDFEYFHKMDNSTRKIDVHRKIESNNSLSTTTEIHRIWLTLYKGPTSVGQALIAYATGATQGIDSNFDAPYFNDSPVALTSIINNGEYIIQGRGLPFLDTDVVTLGFKTNIAGSYTISLANFDGLFVGNQVILLKDNLTGVLHNLKTTPYTFTTIEGVFNQRFELYYKAETTTYENGVWDYGLPTITTKAIIKSNFTTLPNSSLSAKELTLISGVFTLKSGSTLTVAEKITNNTGVNQFIIESDAVVLQNSSLTNEGLFTVSRNSASLFRNDYTLWSSPVEDQNLRTFSPQTLFNRFYSYNTDASNPNNPGNGDYQQELYTTNDINTKTFQSGKGYLIRMPNNWNINGVENAAPYLGNFKGLLQNGDVNMPLSLANTKFNLVGNPYPSPISIDAFFTVNPDIESVLYFWRKTNGAGGSGYHTYNLLGSSNDVEIDNIKTGQGFFVQSNTATSLIFNNTMRVNSGTSEFFKSAQNTANYQSNRYWLKLSKGTENVGQTLIGYVTNATNLVDSGYDAPYFNDSPMALTSLIDTKEFIIQGRSLPFVNTDAVPLVFKTDVAGTFTISLSNFDGLFAENQSIYLKDFMTNSLHDLKAEAYTFTTPVGVFNNRFEVQYNGTLGINNPNVTNTAILISVKDHQIKVNSGSVLMEKIEIIDLAGRVIYNLEKLNSTTINIENLLISKQMLILRITTREKGVVSQKIMI